MTDPVSFLTMLVDNEVRRLMREFTDQIDVTTHAAIHSDPDGAITLHFGSVRIRPEAVARMKARRPISGDAP